MFVYVFLKSANGNLECHGCECASLPAELEALVAPYRVAGDANFREYATSDEYIAQVLNGAKQEAPAAAPTEASGEAPAAPATT